MSEETFAKLLQVLRDLYSAIQSMAGFTPRQNSIKTQSLADKISRIDQLNTDIAKKEEIIGKKQKERQLLVYGRFEKDGQDGIIRLTRQVVKYVDGLGEECESELERIKRLLDKIAPSKSRRKPKDETDKTHSVSERSFGSMEKNARDIHSVIKDISDYAPVDTNIGVEKFGDKVAQLKTYNEEISDLINKELSSLVKKRQIEYSSKTNGIRKILSESKKYVIGCYGINSDEYNKIRLIKI